MQIEDMSLEAIQQEIDAFECAFDYIGRQYFTDEGLNRYNALVVELLKRAE